MTYTHTLCTSQALQQCAENQGFWDLKSYLQPQLFQLLQLQRIRRASRIALVAIY